MRPLNVPVKLLVKHSKNCHAVEHWKENPWAYFGSHDRTWDRADRERVKLCVYLTADGKKRKSGGNFRWITAGCNDPDCPAVVAVREDSLLRIVQSSLDWPERAA